jgi:hypothetical protein
MRDEKLMPMVKHRACGGWLAVAPPGSRFSIGTTGETEQEAITNFRTAWDRWTQIVDGGAQEEKP